MQHEWSYGYINPTEDQGFRRHKIIQEENSYDPLSFMPKEMKLMAETNGDVTGNIINIGDIICA